ncbi:unnamed protein product [Oncorhynchus mykiss]|uniref:Dedicator of cytokinesis TPR repeats region domain-containing protein n=1 Tax=Oncorhynchus mykiss TaxID=8022 RepID=A0A060Z106_ONCMY|nr:unnamed protein product [Oncorhynchus mykiss]
MVFPVLCVPSRELIRCLKWYMDRSAEVVKQDHIQEAMRALEYLLKFIIQSRILYSRATCGMEEEQFRASIQELFQSIRFVLSLDSRSSETLIFTQTPQVSQPDSGQGQPPGPNSCTQAWSSNAPRPSPLSVSSYSPSSIGRPLTNVSSDQFRQFTLP